MNFTRLSIRERKELSKLIKPLHKSNQTLQTIELLYDGPADSTYLSFLQSIVLKSPKSVEFRATRPECFNRTMFHLVRKSELGPGSLQVLHLDRFIRNPSKQIQIYKNITSPSVGGWMSHSVWRNLLVNSRTSI